MADSGSDSDSDSDQSEGDEEVEDLGDGELYDWCAFDTAGGLDGKKEPEVKAIKKSNTISEEKSESSAPATPKSHPKPLPNHVNNPPLIQPPSNQKPATPTQKFPPRQPAGPPPASASRTPLKFQAPLAINTNLATPKTPGGSGSGSDREGGGATMMTPKASNKTIGASPRTPTLPPSTPTPTTPLPNLSSPDPNSQSVIKDTVKIKRKKASLPTSMVSERSGAERAAQYCYNLTQLNSTHSIR